MRILRLVLAFAVLVTLAVGGLWSQQPTQSQKPDEQKQTQQSQSPNQKIAAGSKVYIASMDGFETYLKTAIVNKHVPLELVEQRENAAYEITGVSESKKAGVGKILIMGSIHSSEEASIRMTNIKSGEVVYAYSVHKQNSAHGKQSTAEACAKHLKDEAVTAK
jgi:hypothetical protein